MVLIIILFIFCFILFFMRSYNFDVKSFLRKGFKVNSERFGLVCYTGKQGTGKTYSCVHFLTRVLPSDYLIVTNVHSLVNNLQNSMYIKNINDIIRFCEANYENKKICVFYDEIFSVIEKNRTLGKNILSFISQLRKRKILFVTTAQEWSEINITLRRYVRYQVSCRFINFPKFSVFFNSVHDGDTMHWNNDTQEFVSDLLYVNVHKANKKISALYDTYETIDTT